MKLKYSTIIVNDMDESIKFYTGIMGFEIDSQFSPQPETNITLLKSDGDALVELIKNPTYEIGMYSMGMEVKDLNATVEELESKGAVITMGPVPITDGFLAFTEDPNGVRIALIQHG